MEPAAPGDRHDSARLLLVAGLLTWALIAVPYVAAMLAQQAARGPATLIWSIAHITFGALLVAGYRIHTRAGARHAAHLHRQLLALQTVAAIVAIGVMRDGLVMILLVIVAAQVPLSSSLRVSLAWVGAQTAIAAPLAMADETLGRAIVDTGTQLGFQLFAVYASTTAVRERAARGDLARMNAELVSTRELLAESSRLAERRRIARELHDLMGHHLTALSLQLEAASHLADGALAEQIRDARGLAADLLDDVRQVVRAFRTDDGVDLAGPLRTLAKAMPRPTVHLEMPPDLEIDDPVRANAVLRSVQEVVTNAARHARADHLWIVIERSASGLVLRARDDGRGARRLRLGSGLAGLRERLEELGGSLELATAPGRGFRVAAELPLSEPAT